MNRFYASCLLSFFVLATHAAPPPSEVSTSATALASSTTALPPAVSLFLEYINHTAMAELDSLVCNMDYSDPAQTWKASGASAYLESFLKANGDEGWANKLDRQNSGGPSQVSTLDCSDLVGGTCPVPATGTCMAYTPVVYFHIRNAMATCYNVFTALRTKLVENTIYNALEVDTLVKDFGEQIPKETKVFAILSAVFGLVGAAGIDKPEIAGPSAVLGSFALLIDSTKGGQEVVDPTAQVKDQLAQMFKATEGLLEITVKTVFGGGLATAQLTGLMSPEGETQNIAKFFAGGKFLLQNNGQGAISDLIGPSVATAALRMKQALVGAALKYQNYFVFVDTTVAQGDCGNTPGGQWINGQCYTIQKFNQDYRPHWSSGPGKPAFTVAISQDQVSKLASNTYQIDIVELYKNADECQSAHPNFDGSITPTYDQASGLPPCFYNMPVLKAQGDACIAADEAKPPLPSSLGADICKRSPTGFHPPRQVRI